MSQDIHLRDTELLGEEDDKPREGSRVHTESLVKQYGGRRVVNDVSIELNQGEIVGLLGPNGAGKSTTFNMIVGLIRPNAGGIFLDGKDLSRMPIHRRARMGLGYLAQDTSVFRRLTVEQNLKAIAEAVPGLSKADQQSRIERLLEELGVEHLRNSRADTLSGGERRRTEIARALVPDPKFILLDEPFAAIDPIAVQDLQGIIRQLKRRGLGVLITDHSARETLQVCDRAYLINKGEVLRSGTSRFLAEDPVARKIYLSEDFYIQLDDDAQ